MTFWGRATGETVLCCSGWTLPQFLIQLNVSFCLIGWSTRLVYQYLVGGILFIPVWQIIFCSYFKAQISLIQFILVYLKVSVLGPLLFLLYLVPLGHILSTFKGISYLCSADDNWFYTSFHPNEIWKLSSLLKCLDTVKQWMAGSSLQLNQEKNEIIRTSWFFGKLGELFTDRHQVIPEGFY